jgi:tRNA(Ile)-lysidine synthase
LVLGFSGGPDSLCLLDILQKCGYALVITHLDHQLRPESKQEAFAIQNMAKARNLACFIETADVNRYAKQHGFATEEASRNLRYRFLFQVARQENAQAVVVGHNADDQIETVLMHLLRGAGMSGLIGMRYRSLPNVWSDSIPLLRPLLGVWRKHILDYIEENNLKPFIDASNLDTTFYRNRIRHELIPYMESFNPRLREVIWRTAEIIGEDNAVLQVVTDEAWQNCHLETGKGFVALDVSVLVSQPTGIQRRILRHAIAHLRPSLRDIDYRKIAQTLDFLAAPTKSSQIELIAGLHLLMEGERLWLHDETAKLPQHQWPQVADSGSILDIPGELELLGGWKICATVIADTGQTRKQALENTDPYQAWLDMDILELPLAIRTRRPGDRILPLGMDGKSIKLSDLMVNVKLPQRARGSWPLVVSGAEIVWVPGIRLAHPYRVSRWTRRTMQLKLVKPNTAN